MRPATVPVPARCEHLAYDARGFPIISVVSNNGSEVSFGAISEKRKLVLATFDLCAVCGKPFRDELRWQVAFGDELPAPDDSPIGFNEAPVHEICALLAAQVCPFVSSPYARHGDEYRKGQQREKTLLLAGFEHTAEVWGHESALQPGEWILSFAMDRIGPVRQLTSAEDAARAYRDALAAEAPLVLDDDEQAILDVLCSPTPDNEDSGGVLAGAAWMIGAAFCPDIDRVQGMSIYTKRDTYLGIAMGSLIEPDKLVAFEKSRDPSTVAAMRWFLHHRDRLPPVLAEWRTAAMDGMHARERARNRRPDPATAARRRAAEVARRRKKRS
ncbi:MAG: hypothetical protein ACRDWT_04605 [Jatrophihabitantaceae bacterium]